MDNYYNQQTYPYGGNPEPEKAPNIFQQFVLAFIPPQYDRLIKVRTGSMIGFVTLLALIATILSYVGFAISFTAGNDSGWAESVPEFEVSDGRLYIEDDFTYDKAGTFIYITDDINGFTYDNAREIAKEGYRNVLLIGRDRLSLMQNGEYQQVNLRNLGDDLEISKDWVVNTLMPLMMVFITIGYLFFFVGRVFWYFLCAAVYMLFALILAAIMKKQMSAGAMFRTAVYSKVLMFVVVTLLELVPFVHIPMRFMLRIAITIGFMAFAIAKLPEKNI